MAGTAGAAYPLLVQSDLFGEALLGEVTHGIIVSIRQEMRQLVLSLGILLHGTTGFGQLTIDMHSR